jgi:predicted MPP superfamily phosphohydrolase
MSGRWFAEAISLTAGSSLFLLILNRQLILIRDSSYKGALIAVTFVALIAGSWFYGSTAGFSGWIFLPAAVLAALLAGEVRRGVIRWRLRGSSPAETENANISLSKPFTTTDLRTDRYEVLCPDWRGREFTVVHISDLHIDEHPPYEYYLGVMDRVNEANPDLIFITGDFVSRDKYTPVVPGLLKRLDSRRGIFAVLGNHDYWAGAQGVAEAVLDAGVVLLYNGSRQVDMDDGNRIHVWGCEDPWSETQWRPPGAAGDEIVLALSHSPDNIYDLSNAGATAVFAGHHHAGQFRIPLFGSVIVPSRFGRRFDHGHFVVGGAHLFVSAGIGVGSPAFRLYSQPDIFVVKFSGNPTSPA